MLKIACFFILAGYFVNALDGTLGVLNRPQFSKRTISLVKRGDLTYYNPGPPGNPGM
ncbi:hypothetical protein HMI54_014211, partial [Coelomomyces lativittatus]